MSDIFSFHFLFAVSSFKPTSLCSILRLKSKIIRLLINSFVPACNSIAFILKNLNRTAINSLIKSNSETLSPNESIIKLFREDCLSQQKKKHEREKLKVLIGSKTSMGFLPQFSRNQFIFYSPQTFSFLANIFISDIDHTKLLNQLLSHYFTFIREFFCKLNVSAYSL
jgi:hypothetical protein